MSAIFQDVVLGWGGKEYRVTPTMRLLNTVEQRVSLSALAHSLATGHPRLTHLATAVALFLQHAGVVVTEEEVYQEIMHGGQEQTQVIASAIVLAAFPAQKVQPGGNAPAPKSARKRRT